MERFKLYPSYSKLPSSNLLVQLCGEAVHFFLADGDLQQREWIFCSSVTSQKV